MKQKHRNSLTFLFWRAEATASAVRNSTCLQEDVWRASRDGAYIALWLLCAVLLAGCRSSAQEPQAILYLWYDADDNWQLYKSDLSGAATQLTDGANIYDYAPSPDGRQVAYSATAADGSRSLYLLELADNHSSLLLDCAPAICQTPVWTSDSRRILYERRSQEGDEPRLFWLAIANGETVAVFDDDAVLGYNARLSHDDRFISFVAPGAMQAAEGATIVHDDHEHTVAAVQQPTVVFDLEKGAQLLIPSLMNSPAVWHPAASELLLPELQFFGEQVGSHLLRVDVLNNTTINLATGQVVEDAAPSWSPGGDQIVFHRKLAATPMGRQLWLMQADGSDAQALTENANWHHGAAQFSADGSSVLFQRFDISQPNAEPSLWLYDLATGTEQQIVANGSRPLWLP